jgi:hypothetical protein
MGRSNIEGARFAGVKSFPKAGMHTGILTTESQLSLIGLFFIHRGKCTAITFMLGLDAIRRAHAKGESTIRVAPIHHRQVKHTKHGGHEHKEAYNDEFPDRMARTVSATSWKQSRILRTREMTVAAP